MPPCCGSSSRPCMVEAPRRRSGCAGGEARHRRPGRRSSSLKTDRRKRHAAGAASPEDRGRGVPRGRISSGNEDMAMEQADPRIVHTYAHGVVPMSIKRRDPSPYAGPVAVVRRHPRHLRKPAASGVAGHRRPGRLLDVAARRRAVRRSGKTPLHRGSRCGGAPGAGPVPSGRRPRPRTGPLRGGLRRGRRDPHGRRPDPPVGGPFLVRPGRRRD